MTFGSRKAVRPTGSWKRGEPHDRLRGATNPHVVEGSDLRIGPAAEEAAEAGRNGRSGTSVKRGSFTPKSG
jgi:hypothetical protein